MGFLLKGYRVCVLSDEEFGRWVVVVVAQHCECNYCH